MSTKLLEVVNPPASRLATPFQSVHYTKQSQQVLWYKHVGSMETLGRGIDRFRSTEIRFFRASEVLRPKLTPSIVGWTYSSLTHFATVRMMDIGLAMRHETAVFKQIIAPNGGFSATRRRSLTQCTIYYIVCSRLQCYSSWRAGWFSVVLSGRRTELEGCHPDQTSFAQLAIWAPGFVPVRQRRTSLIKLHHYLIVTHE